MPIPEEKHYAPVGAYNFSIDENGQFTIVPTYRADRTVTVTKPEEYINPEFIVTPRSVKPLVDDTGKPAYSVDAYNIVQEEKHKPLNSYQYYMESKSVAPKDVETEHLMQRYRSDQAAERSNLSPFFANLLTGMYATAAQEGWNNIKNGKYFTGAAEVLSPLMFGEDAWNKVAQGIYGGIQLLNENGVPKTWEEIKRGNYGRAALSGAGDLFNLTLAGVGGNQIYKSTLNQLASNGNTWARAKLIANTLDNFTPITEHNIIIENIGTPKQSRMFSKGTYPIYTGPKHSILEVVNTNGTVNPRVAMRIQHEVANYFKQFGKGAYKMEERLENPEWHTLDPNTYLHTKNVAQTAYQLPTPPGFTKQDQMIAALGHDFGKIVSGDGHGEIGASLIKQIFPDATPEQIAAVAEHMQSNPQTILGQYTKAADIINGRGESEILLNQGEPNLYNIITKVNRTVQPNGKIRLSLPSHTDSAPRQFVLEPAPEGNNKYYVHMRVWDDPKNKVPGNITDAEKQQLFDALYNELPEGAEILFPQSSPEVPGTRGTVAGLMRLRRDPRFRPGNQRSTLYYEDKDHTIRTYEGTSFIKNSNGTTIGPVRGIEGTPRITSENAMLISPEEWNRQFRAAEARGDIEEGQRLRDIWFNYKAPNTQMSGTYYRSERGEKPFYKWDTSRLGENGQRMILMLRMLQKMFLDQNFLDILIP